MISLLLLNALFAAVGLFALWSLGALDGTRVAVLLLGLAHLLGTALCVLLTIDFVLLGLGLTAGLMASTALVAAAGAAVRLLRSHRLDHVDVRWTRTSLLSLPLLVPPAVALALQLRVAPHLGVWEPDAVSTWTYRAKVLYFANGFDAGMLKAGGAFAYPVFESMLQALDFVALGRADDLAFHVQFGIMLVSFVAAVAGASRWAGVRSVFVCPLVGLFVLTPEVQARALSPLADLNLDYLFALGALLLLLWVERRTPWLFYSATILLGAAISTKREGLPLAFVAFAAAAAVVTLEPTRRAALVPLAGFGVAVLTIVPWRIWVGLHASASDLGNLSPGSLTPSPSKILPATHLLAERTFSYGAWLLVVPAALVIAAGAFFAGGPARRTALFLLFGATLTFASFLAIWFLVPDLQTAADQEQPAVRLAGALVAFSVAVAPVVAARALGVSGRRSE